MVIKIDNRESNLNTILSSMKQDIPVQIEALPLGDIILLPNENEEIIIERKTLQDLAASIKDGRYNEQSIRLHNCSCPNHNIFYLIEGDLTFFKPSKFNNIDKNSLLSAITTLSYYKGFSIYRSISTFDSAEWIIAFYKKIKKEKKIPFYSINTSTPMEYSNTRVKSNNINKENISIIMLCQIPKVSKTIAKTIMDEYKNMDNLIISLKKDKNLLQNLKIETKTGQKRNISKPAIENIYNFLITDLH